MSVEIIATVQGHGEAVKTMEHTTKLEAMQAVNAVSSFTISIANMFAGFFRRESSDATDLAKLRQSFTRAVGVYVIALRPWSFSASLMPVALGSALSWRDTSQFSPVTFFFSAIVVVSVHAAGNLVKNYHDHLKSKSENETGLTLQGIVRVGVLLYFLACVGLLGVKCSSPAKIEHLAFLFFGGLSGSFLYTGGISLQYHSIGDLIIVITFGPIAVLFSYMAQCGHFNFAPMLYAVPLALNTEAVLHSENARDSERDKVDGVVTMATILGPSGSYVFYLFLLFTPYVIFSVLFVKGSLRFILPMVTVRAAFDLEKCFRERKMGTVALRTAKLNVYLGIMYVLLAI